MNTKIDSWEPLDRIIGGLILHCGNVYNEQGTDISKEVGEYIFKELSTSHNQGYKSAVEDVRGKLEKAIELEPNPKSDWEMGYNKALDTIIHIIQEQNI